MDGMDAVDDMDGMDSLSISQSSRFPGTSGRIRIEAEKSKDCRKSIESGGKS